MTSKLVHEDIDRIINDKNLNWGKLCGSTILVTGATGLIGSFICNTFAGINNMAKADIRIICLGRNTEKLEQLKSNCSLFIPVRYDLRDESLFRYLPEKIDYIFHCAAITGSKVMVSAPVDVISTSVNGTQNILNIAKRCGCKKTVYLSSMEVYGKTGKSEITENNLGYLDLTDPRSSYPESKRMCENLCISYSVQYGVPVSVARLAQTFGAGTPISDTRVFAEFARCAINGTDIVLHTDGSSRGNYCYLSETISGLLYILTLGEDRGIYNIANPDASHTILEMAEIVARDICHDKIKVIIDDGNDKIKRKYAAKTEHRLNSDKLRSLCWSPVIGLKEMYERLIDDWRESK